MSEASTPVYEAAKVVSLRELFKKSHALHKAELTRKEKLLLFAAEYPLHAAIEAVSLVRTFKESFNDARFLAKQGIEITPMNTIDGKRRDNENKRYMTGALIEQLVNETDASPLNKLAPKKLREKSRALDVRAFNACEDHQHNLLVKPSAF